MEKGEEVHRPDSLQVCCGSKSNSGQLLLLGFTYNRKRHFSEQETPRNVTCPPHSLEFYYEHGGRTLGGETSTDVAKLCDLEMRNRSANRRKYGAAIRHLTKRSVDPTSLGRNSVKRRMLFGIANAHSRKMRKSKPYAVLHEMKRTGDMITEHHPDNRKKAILCPFHGIKEAIRGTFMFSARVRI